MLPANHAYTQYVKRVAGRIIKAAGMQGTIHNSIFGYSIDFLLGWTGTDN